MQPEKGEGYHPWGVTEQEWKRRTGTAYEEWENYALYNAPPGTEQHMAVYYYLSPKGDRATHRSRCWPTRTTMSSSRSPDSRC